MSRGKNRRRRRESKYIRDARKKLEQTSGAVSAQQLEQTVAAARAQQQTGEKLEELLKQVMPAELQERNPESVSMMAGLLTFDPQRITKAMAMLADRTLAEGRLLATARAAGAQLPDKTAAEKFADKIDQHPQKRSREHGKQDER